MAYDVTIKTTEGIITTEIKELEELEELLIQYYKTYISVETKHKKLELKKDGIQKR